MKQVICFLLVVSIIFPLTFSFAHAYDLNETEKQMIKNTVKEKLKDPYSAKFKFYATEKNKVGYCFKLNAKNSYGGYTGDIPVLTYLNWKDGKIVSVEHTNIGEDDDALGRDFVLDVCNNLGFTF